jgi:GH15 family glucan-1,4-alpha-glucosidase
MSQPIEDYGFISNMITGALVGRDGSIDWLCLPRFDSGACFAALLGTPEHGRWLIAPDGGIDGARRRYLPGTAVIETMFETREGTATLTDFMPLSPNERTVELIRIVRGIKGRVAMKMEFVLRFDYGQTVPWVRRRDYGLRAVAGPNSVDLVTPAPLRGEGMKTFSEFSVENGQSIPFTLAYHPSNGEPRFIDDREDILRHTVEWWQKWSGRCALPSSIPDHWKNAVVRSLITLKSMTFQPTGGIVAAPTTSLPENIGGARNWDYRYCWIRDATLTLYSLINSSYFKEAGAFGNWLLRAAAGLPEQMQIMYGLAGERLLTEIEIPWLPGYRDSRPVRIGNAAHTQLQLDVYGELMDALHLARRSKLGPYDAEWRLQCVLLRNLERLWRKTDQGIWETRGPSRHFTYSKIMSWVAFDRGIKAIEEFGLDGPLDRWRAIKDEIFSDVIANGYDKSRNTFIQYYGGAPLDASLLLIAQVGFLPPQDPRFRGTVEAIEAELLRDGFVLRYRPEHSDDGMEGNEGSFLACSFWLADAYILLDRRDDALELFERLLSVRNCLGLLSEEYDRHGGFLGNFPQAFPHVALVNTAHNIIARKGPASQRANREEVPSAQGTSKGNRTN